MEKLTMADEFKITTEKRYRFDLEAFKRGFGPNPWERRKGKIFYCQFRVTFSDGSSISCVMTLRQRDAIVRSLIYNQIETIGGEGYRELIETI